MTKSIFIFKIKFIKSEQPLLPFSDITTSEMFKTALEQKPKIPSRYNDAIWHIGNIIYIDDTSGTFRFGKQTPSEFAIFYKITEGQKKVKKKIQKIFHYKITVFILWYNNQIFRMFL